MAHRALQQQRIAVLGQHARRALAVPPRHQQAAEFLLGFHGHFQHRRHAVPPHGQEPAAARHDQVAVGRQLPTGEILAEHRAEAIGRTGPDVDCCARDCAGDDAPRGHHVLKKLLAQSNKPLFTHSLRTLFQEACYASQITHHCPPSCKGVVFLSIIALARLGWNRRLEICVTAIEQAALSSRNIAVSNADGVVWEVLSPGA